MHSPGEVQPVEVTIWLNQATQTISQIEKPFFLGSGVDLKALSLSLDKDGFRNYINLSRQIRALKPKGKV